VSFTILKKVHDQDVLFLPDDSEIDDCVDISVRVYRATGFFKITDGKK